MPNIHFKKATSADLQKLKSLVYTTFHDSFGHLNSQKNMQLYSDTALTDERILNELKDPNSTFCFANNETETVGYFKITKEANYPGDETTKGMQLGRIYILSKFQGQKIGQFILEEVIGMAKKAKAPFLWLGVWEKNPGAVKFYKRNGFVLDGKITFQLGEEEQWDYLMKLDL